MRDGFRVHSTDTLHGLCTVGGTLCSTVVGVVVTSHNSTTRWPNRRLLLRFLRCSKCVARSYQWLWSRKLLINWLTEWVYTGNYELLWQQAMSLVTV